MYNHTNFCQNTKSVDKMFKTFKKTKDDFLTGLNRDPTSTLTELWGDNSILPTDRECKYQLGKKNTDISMIKRQSFTCAMCKTLSSLISGNGLIENNIISIKCGNKAGDILKIEDHVNVHKVLVSDELKVIIYNNINLVYDDTILFELDSFTNEIVQNVVMESIWSNNVIKYYTYFVCANNGYILMDDITNIKELHLNTETDINGLIGQLLSSLKMYSACALCLGEPSLDTIGFINEPISYEYNGCHVKCPITLKFKKLESNSIDIKGGKYRFVKRNHVDKMITKNKTSLINDIEVISEYPTVIKFNQQHFDIYRKYMNLGIPLFATTWNTYICFIMIMMIPEINKQIREIPTLYALWETLWKHTDITKINENVESQNIKWKVYFVDHCIQVGVLDDLWKMYKSKKDN